MNNKRRQVCIIGLGQFGAGLARFLTKEADILAIDKNMDKVNTIAESVSKVICIDVKNFSTLASAVSNSFDEAVISIGEDLEASILATLHLKKIGIRSIRVKASSEEHAEILKAIGATEIIFPELDTAERLTMKILHPNFLDFIPLTLDYHIMDILSLPEFHGCSLESIHFRNRFGLFIIAIKKKTESEFIFLPGPEYVIQPNDILMVIGRKDDITKIGNHLEK